ncbi:unnamed protein product [Linum tenue]|uniref:Uncharacterized protein n=1 Tax=Linum tenue TaxID=586396 RepID=A0AAV0IX82_9ROSI|nr:unnamed protein product [Linum tenue]
MESPPGSSSSSAVNKNRYAFVAVASLRSSTCMPSFSASSLATHRILVFNSILPSQLLGQVILSMLLEWSVDPDIVNRHKQASSKASYCYWLAQ